MNKKTLTLMKKLQVFSQKIEQKLLPFKISFPLLKVLPPREESLASVEKKEHRIKKNRQSPTQKKLLKNKNFIGSSYKGKGKINTDTKWFNHPRKETPSGRKGH